MHNFANFDGYFILEYVLNSVYLKNKFGVHKYVKTFISNNQIYSLSFIDKKQKLHVEFLDSYKMTNISLQKLAFLSNVNKLKYEVANLDLEKMISVYNNQKEFLKFLAYCRHDSLVLVRSMKTLQQVFYQEFAIDISLYRTAPSLALKFFCSDFYKIPEVTYLSVNKKAGNFLYKKDCFVVTPETSKDAIFLTSRLCFLELKLAFFGGRIEAFKPFGVNLVVLDENSKYPSAGTAPLPTGKAFFVYVKINQVFDLFNFYGFVEVCWVSPYDGFENNVKKVLPVLPQKSKIGNLYALGAGRGWYHSSEVQLAVKFGYKVKVLKGLRYEAKKPILRKYIRFLYKLRVTTKNIPLKFITKLLLVSLSYGKFAARIGLSKTSLFTHPEKKANLNSLEKKINNEEIGTVLYFKKTNFLLFTNTEKNQEDLAVAGFLERTAKSKQTSESFKPNQFLIKHQNQAMHISASVTAQSRVSMYPFLAFAYNKSKLFYTDTDSIYMSKSLLKNRLFKKRIHQEFVIEKNNIVITNDLSKSFQNRPSSNLGFFKIENFFTSCIFATSKFLLGLKFKKEFYIDFFEKKNGKMSPPSYLIKLSGYKRTSDFETDKLFVSLLKKYPESFKKNSNLFVQQENISFLEKKFKFLSIFSNI
uniref:putative DNA polymerase of type B n=1 Tax=Coelastrella saipanensis TaxID=152631 RepID=UPI0010C34BB5|nr:putative DNA polymerase of type B [Coelastrella saipanensis]AVV61556.1 putative DNA polymerase of type B [Coelastrella saipanensis]